MPPARVAVLADEDLDPLARFLSGWPGEPMSPEVWRRRFDVWWTRNPYLAPAVPRGYVIRDGARIAGFFGLVPLGFQLGGREIVAFGSTSWMVETEFRHLSLGALAALIKVCRDSILFVWTSTPSLIKMLEALRFQTMPRPTVFRGRQPTTLLLRPGRALATMLAPRSPALASLASMLGRPVDLLSAHAALVWARTRVASHGISARRVARADAAFDQLWERTRHRVANTNPRTAKFLDWHCDEGGVFAKHLYGCRRGESGPLLGLLIAAVKDARGLRVLECADVWTDPDEPHALDALFAKLVADGFHVGFDAIELPNYDDAIHAFAARQLLLPRAVSDRTELVLAKKEILAELRADNSYFCGLQGDRFL